MADQQYRKLVGRSSMSVQRCYLGKDHLLILDGAYRERIKRIRFVDIEAVLICPTKSGNAISLIAGLTGFFLLIVTLANTDSAAFWVWLGLTVIAWAVFARGMYGKGSALMGVQTAVQTVHLEGVTTMRKAHKIESRLNEIITAAQGQLSAEDIAQYKSQNSQTRQPRPAPAPPPLARPGPPVPPELPA